jgi:type II secretory ATPase GspE/PulE/Tfp pilus assembly ATPase PilB-like protein
LTFISLANVLPLGVNTPVRLFDFFRRSPVERPVDGTAAQHYLSGCGIRRIFEASRLLDLLLEDARHWQATDIHLIPVKDQIQVKFRIDGALRDMLSVEAKQGRFLVQRIKVVSGMDFLNSWEPQDGAGERSVAGDDVVFRASTMPVKTTVDTAERAVLRLYWKRDFNLENLQFDLSLLQSWRRLISEPQGMLVVTGPANSGKTTTLYSSLLEIQRIFRGERNQATVEDPVEFPVDGLSQSQVNPKDNFGFAEALRAMMRQDPQVIMVGEIRDSETASMAINASLSGHLILTTVHSKQVTGVFPRLQSLGIDPVRAASAVLAILNQRLIRLNCTECAAPYQPTDQYLQYLPASVAAQARFQRGIGCAACGKTGFHGRTTAAELLTLDSELRAAVCSCIPSQELYDRAIASGMATIWQNALRRVCSGQAPLEETVQVVGTETG